MVVSALTVVVDESTAVAEGVVVGSGGFLDLWLAQKRTVVDT